MSSRTRVSARAWPTYTTSPTIKKILCQVLSGGRQRQIQQTTPQQRGKTSTTKSLLAITQNCINGEAPVLELLGIWSIPPLTLLSGLLWSVLLAPVWVKSMGQIELFDHLRGSIIIIGYLKPCSCVWIISFK